MSAEKNESKNIIEKKRKLEKIKKKKGKKKLIALLLIIILLVAFSNSSNNKGKMNQKFDYEEVVADVGNIDVIVEGKGTIEENSVYNIFPTVKGEIIEDNVEVGKMVNKDELLYVIDSSDIDATLSSARLAVEQAQINYNNTKKQVDDLKIVANANGHISGLTVVKGAFISNTMQICNISEKNNYEVILKFANPTASPIQIGDRASLSYISYFKDIEGVVTNVADKSTLLDEGAQVVDVTIKVETTGYSLENAQVRGTVYTSGGASPNSAGSGYFKSITNNMVKAKSMGTVKEVLVKEGDYVTNGTVIAILENSDLEIALNNAEITLKNARNSLENANKQLENYHITSPISGIVAYKNNKLGDVISNYQSASSNTMVTIVDDSRKKFEMEIDELDIAKIKIGQSVKITLDALEGKEYEGKVANINTMGKNVAGITSYTVLVEVDNFPEIYSGMNVDADIQILSIENVMRIPLAAVRKGNVVYRKVSDINYQDQDTKVPMGYEKVSVEIGQNNSDYIEILSGINEGDVVLIDKLTQSGILDFGNLHTGA